MAIFPHDGVVAFPLLSILILNIFLGIMICCLVFSIKFKTARFLNVSFIFFPCSFLCQPGVHVYLKYFSRFMTTMLRVLLGFLLCCSCTQDVSVGPPSHLPYLSFCIRSDMCCYNYVACNKQNDSIHSTESTVQANQRTALILKCDQVNVFCDTMIH